MQRRKDKEEITEKKDENKINIDEENIEENIKEEKSLKSRKKANSNIKEKLFKKMKKSRKLDYPQCYIYAENLLNESSEIAIVTEQEKQMIKKMYEEAK